MKRFDMEKSSLTPFTFCCVTALVAALVPAGHAQDGVHNLESAPRSIFDDQREEAVGKFLSAGPISIRPHVYADVYYDDNLTLRRSRKLEDLVWRLEPGALLGLGEFRGEKGTYLSLDYTMRGSLYSKYDEFNSLDHHVIMSGGWKTPKLTLGLSQSYQIESGKQAEAGEFVEQESYVTLLTSKYELSDKTSFELNGRQSLVDTVDQVIKGPDVDLNTINEWVVEGWADYKATDKLKVGAGGTVGWRDIRGFTPAPTPNQVFEQGLVRAAYRATEKLEVQGSAGVQFSQFQDGEDKGPTFIFSLGGSWQATERTSVSLEAFRRDVPSYVQSGRNYTLTGLRGGVRQQFLEKFYLSLGAGFENSDYTKDSSLATGSDRSDNYFWVRPALDYQLSERWSTGAYYQYRTKSSNQPLGQYDYSNNQIGLYTSYRF